MGHSMIKECKPLGDKFMRAMAQTAQFEGRFVKLPNQTTWLEAYRHELMTFPRGKFDDQVDSTSQALSWMARTPSEPPYLTFNRQECERMRRKL